MSFQDAMTTILKFEGGYTVDDGGPTNYGITQSTYDSWRFKSVKEIQMDEVYAIYNGSYWKASASDQIDQSSSKLALTHFDCAVNCGTVTSIKMLQRVLNVTADGIWGPHTSQAVIDQAQQGDEALVTAYLNARASYYRGLSNFHIYGDSWLHRLDDLAKQFGIPWTSAQSN